VVYCYTFLISKSQNIRMVKTKQNISHYFEVLKLRENSSIKEIKARYRELAKIYHPDLNSSKDAEEKFKEINEAYSKILSIKENEIIYRKNRKRHSKNIRKEVIFEIKREIKNSIRAEIKKTISSKKNFIFKSCFSHKNIKRTIKEGMKKMKFL